MSAYRQTRQRKGENSNPSFIPDDKYGNMSNLQLVQDLLRCNPEPIKTILVGVKDNPLIVEAKIDLAPTAAALINLGKVRKRPTRRFGRIFDTTMKIVLKKGEERKRDKLAATSNVERGVTDEVVEEEEQLQEPSYDDSRDSKFQPKGEQNTGSDSSAEDADVEKQTLKKTKRKLDMSPKSTPS